MDFFKVINNRYGHAAGDQILREFSDESKKHVRNGKDWIAGFGGEEFMICLPDTDIGTAKAIAERIRKSIMEKTFTAANEQIHVN